MEQKQRDWLAGLDAKAVAHLLQASGWGVVVARPGRPMPAIWAELCHATGTGALLHEGGWR